MTAMDADVMARVMGERFTCRAFRPDPVPEPTIREIVTLAGQTASWSNTQPWGLIVTRNGETDRFRERLLAQAGTGEESGPDIPFPLGFQGAMLQRRRDTGYALYAALGIDRQDYAARKAQAMENFRLFGAPHVAILTVDAAMGPYGLLDCGGLVASFMLAAQAHGVQTAAQAALVHHAGLIRDHFEIPDDRHVVCGISFGYADRDHPANGFRTSRAPLDEIVRFV